MWEIRNDFTKQKNRYDFEFLFNFSYPKESLYFDIEMLAFDPYSDPDPLRIYTVRLFCSQKHAQLFLDSGIKVYEGSDNLMFHRFATYTQPNEERVGKIIRTVDTIFSIPQVIKKELALTFNFKEHALNASFIEEVFNYVEKWYDSIFTYKMAMHRLKINGIVDIPPVMQNEILCRLFKLPISHNELKKHIYWASQSPRKKPSLCSCTIL